VEILDTELIEDKQYVFVESMPADRVKALLGKNKSARRSKERGKF
jgi:hypothetical protein